MADQYPIEDKPGKEADASESDPGIGNSVVDRPNDYEGDSKIVSTSRFKIGCLPIAIVFLGLVLLFAYTSVQHFEKNKKKNKWTQESLTVYVTQHVPLGSAPGVVEKFLKEENFNSTGLVQHKIITATFEGYDKDILSQRYLSEAWMVVFEFFHGKLKSLKVEDWLSYLHF